MNIAFVSREFPPSRRSGGISTYVWEMAKCLAANGHGIFVIAASDDISRDSNYVDQGIHVTRLSGADFFLPEGSPSIMSRTMSHARRMLCYTSYRGKIAERLLQLVSEYSIDLVEFPEYGNEAAMWSAVETPIPWIVRLHGPTLLNHRTGRPYRRLTSPLRWWFGMAEMSTLRKATGISSPSQAMADKIASFADIPSGRISVIPNAIDADMWIPQKDRLSNEHKGHNISIFSAGSVVEAKGYGDLVEAVEVLRGRGMPVSLEIAGPHGKLGRKLSKQLGPSGKYSQWLRLPGVISRAELAHRYAAADLVVFPSWWESFGLVCVEAMASGALILASEAGGMAEIIRPNADGFLFTLSNHKVLAEEIWRVLQLQLDHRRQIRDRAQQRARTQYSVNKVMQMQLKFYEDVVRRRCG